MRCCGNCEWSISSENEKEIMIENNYEEDDLTRSRAGDCCLCMEHNGEYVCLEHEYQNVGINNYFFYDDKYLGPGYFIITKYYDEIIKFIKLYQTGNGFPGFAIRGYEVGVTDKKFLEYDKPFRKIEIELSDINTLDSDLLEVFKKFTSRINGDRIINVDNLEYGNTSLSLLDGENSVNIILSKDIYSSENNSDFIDIYLGDYYNCDYYNEISLLFRDLAWTSMNKTDENTMKRILRMSK